jgi:hypothetical protein
MQLESRIFFQQSQLKQSRYMGQTHRIVLDVATGMAEYDRILQLSYKRADVVLICTEEGSRTDLTELREIWLPKMEMFRTDQMHIVVCVRDADSEQKKLHTNELLSWDGFAKSVANMLEIDEHVVCDVREILYVRKVLYKVRDLLVVSYLVPTFSGRPRGCAKPSLTSDHDATFRFWQPIYGIRPQIPTCRQEIITAPHHRRPVPASSNGGMCKTVTPLCSESFMLRILTAIFGLS